MELKGCNHLIHTGVKLRDGQCLFKKRRRVTAHSLVGVHTFPLGVHCDLFTIETFVEGSGDKSLSMPD